VTDCPCRNRTETLGVRECKDKIPISETCFQVGLFGEYFLRRGEGREISLVEAHTLVKKLSKKGLVFTVANTTSPIHQVICSCCGRDLRIKTKIVQLNRIISLKLIVIYAQDVLFVLKDVHLKLLQ